MITLSTLGQHSPKEVFEHVKSHLLAQNKKSMDRLSCKYHFKDLRCAAGCLIDKTEYMHRFENRSWGDLITKGLVPDYHGHLIYGLQNIHDAHYPEFWASELDKLEARFRIEPGWDEAPK